MKKLIVGLLLSWLPIAGFASGGEVHLDSAKINLADSAALQRGAKLFVNYCAGCHSLKYFRYEGMKAFGLTDEQIRGNLMPAGGKLGDLITTAMSEEQAAKWFGAAPPDLTLEARLKEGGADWIYTYLRSFYLDSTRPLGVNNRIFPNVGMPHALWELQGWQQARFKEEKDAEGHTHKVFDGLERVSAGKLTPAQYDAAARDLATFLDYVSEPMQQERKHLGVYVLLFLAIFFVLAYRLKKEYWQDVH
jgi:ubiquinol-cytochrome c reductase cytochrome c1 subunit